MNEERRRAIAQGLTAVSGRIADACAKAGRDPGEVTLIVVTKFFPPSDIRILADLGVREVGENRHQEAAAKAAELAGLGLRWHFLGTLQSNKAARVADYVDVVHSVDRAKLVAGLARGAASTGRVVDCLVQVDLDPPSTGSTTRGGAAPADVVPLAELLAATDGLRLRGVMAVAPLEEDPRPAFARLAATAAQVRAVDPSASWLSAGMSGDLEPAIEAGATHVRIGTSVLGKRPEIK